MPTTIKIERTKSRPGGHEEPVRTPHGYELADPRHRRTKHHARHATFVATIREAAALVARGYALRMGRVGLRASLISARSLRIVL